MMDLRNNELHLYIYVWGYIHTYIYVLDSNNQRKRPSTLREVFMRGRKDYTLDGLAIKWAIITF